MSITFNTSDIEWVDELPPTKAGRKGRRSEFVAALKANPGRWAKYGKAGPGYSLKERQALGIEVVMRSGFTYMRALPTD
jgi:hypothetical protein